MISPNIVIPSLKQDQRKRNVATRYSFKPTNSYDNTSYEFENENRIIKRLSNTFFNAFVKKGSDILKKEKDSKQLKKRKLTD
mgnify:CR=1 FL=1